MTIRLIINADDYCRTSEVSRGVRQAHLQGIITSTTCMMNMPNAVEDVRLALQEAPRLGMGVHLVLTSGKPLLSGNKTSTLTMPDGNFPNLNTFLSRIEQIDYLQAKAEWRAQIEKFTTVSGRPPTHLDSHHHSSYFTTELFRGMLELAREFGCAIRLPSAEKADLSQAGFPYQLQNSIREFTPILLAEFKPRYADAFYASFYDEMATNEEILRILNSLPEGVGELICHPGYADEGLIAGSVYNRQRERELKILTDPTMKQVIKQKNIQLISFADV